MKNANPFTDAAKSMESQTVVYSNTELQKISAIAEGIKQLNDFKNIFAVSDFTPLQIMLISKARIIGEFWNINEIETILTDLAVLSLSKNRKSRQEIINALIGLAGKKPIGQRIKEVLKPDEGG